MTRRNSAVARPQPQPRAPGGGRMTSLLLLLVAALLAFATAPAVMAARLRVHNRAAMRTSVQAQAQAQHSSGTGAQIDPKWRAPLIDPALADEQPQQQQPLSARLSASSDASDALADWADYEHFNEDELINMLEQHIRIHGSPNGQ